VLTLLLIIVRKLFDQNYTIFILRAVFLFLLLPLIPFLDQAFFKPTVKYFFWIVLLYGSITTLMQSQLSTDPQIATISILEMLFLIIVSSHLK
jgi:hypothetical protein